MFLSSLDSLLYLKMITFLTFSCISCISYKSAVAVAVRVTLPIYQSIDAIVCLFFCLHSPAPRPYPLPNYTIVVVVLLLILHAVVAVAVVGGGNADGVSGSAQPITHTLHIAHCT